MKRPKDIEKWTGEIAEFAREVEDVTGRTLTPERWARPSG